MPFEKPIVKLRIFDDRTTCVTISFLYKSQDGVPELHQIVEGVREAYVELEKVAREQSREWGENDGASKCVPDALPLAAVSNSSTNGEKVELFMSLFCGREDVYARRWESKDGKKSGYSPVCKNEWVPGVCEKPQVKCADCKNRNYVPLDKQVVARHLAGKEVAGVYPMLPDETCWFVSIDFDDKGWKDDVSVVRAACKRKGIPVAVERSRSGNGAHIWIFFNAPISAGLVRKLGTSILTATMEERHELKFKSYDRLFPSQDTLPKGGFGNLIALPLQRAAREKGNSVFVDENLLPYSDQWAYLCNTKRLAVGEVAGYIAALCKGNELGDLRRTEEDEKGEAPWVRQVSEDTLRCVDFPSELRGIEANMLYIEKEGVSHKALNRLKRLAAFKNPEFYKAQAMRFPTWDKPRIIFIADETEKYLCLPRGCKEEVGQMLASLKVPMRWRDERNAGQKIDVSFKGVLRDEQAAALDALLTVENGTLSATTAFGKTVVAAALIAARKVNTLVLVNRQPLLDQWKARLLEFLDGCVVGQLGGGKNKLGGMVDIAIIQSLVRGDEVKDVVKNYGMVIVDECHHVSAVSFERVLKEVNAKFVYGLTATPKRQDGHHPIITMHCGKIRYADDAKLQAQRRPFGHFVIPRFTPFRMPVEKEERTPTIQEVYAEICQNEIRNNLIVADVLDAVSEGRNALVLTERKSHVESLVDALCEKAPNVMAFVGGQPAKIRKALADKVAAVSASEPLVIVATGKYVGEGFDVPRLDTLFLAMPIAWQGTLAQYAGRLHRLHTGKREARVYDYVDVHVAVLDRMYAKRARGYAAIGYEAKGETNMPDAGNIIFDGANFLPVFTADVLSAKRGVVIVSPFATKNRTLFMLKTLDAVAASGAKVTVVTRPMGDYKESDRERVAAVLDLLREHGVNVIERSKIHQKFTVIDRHITWYGSVNLLCFGNAEESMMRLDSKGISGELLRIL